MAAAETFVLEMEEKNRASFQRLLAGYSQIVEKENLSPADLLRLEMKSIIEAIEVSAMWLAESEHLHVKLALASRCGDGARHCGLLADRLEALGIERAAFDARFGGYSKLFAFFRSLQTVEEQAAAGAVTLKAYLIDRMNLNASHCEAKGDADSAALLRALIQDEDRQREIGRRMLVDTATAEESQARARRSAFRTIELLGELQDASMVRKYLSRSLKK